MKTAIKANFEVMAPVTVFLESAGFFTGNGGKIVFKTPIAR